MDDRARQLAYALRAHRDAQAYAAQHGENTPAPQLEWEGRCPICWQRGTQPHTSLCPNRPPDEEPAAAEQPESLW